MMKSRAGFSILPECSHRIELLADQVSCAHPSVRGPNNVIPVSACQVCSWRSGSTGTAINAPTHNGNGSATSGVRISFCVTLKNRADNLRQMLASWQALEGANHELLIADFGSTDLALHEVIAGRSNITIVDLSGDFNRARGLNAAAAAATGDILFFLDADIVFPHNVCQTIRHHAAPGRAYFPICYSLRQDSPRSETAPGWWRSTGFGLCAIHRHDFGKGCRCLCRSQHGRGASGL